MKTFGVRIEGRVIQNLGEAEIRVLYHSGAIKRDTPCSDSEGRSWRTVDELFPLLKHDAVEHALRPKPPPFERHTTTPGPGRLEISNPRNSAVVAGWICFGLGAAIAWFFPLAHFFFSVAIIISIVAMCTNQVRRGLVLMLSSVAGIAVCTLIFTAIVAGAAASAVVAMTSQMDGQIRRQQAALQSITAPPPSGPLLPALPTPPPVIYNAALRPRPVRLLPAAAPTPSPTPYDTSLEAQLRRIEQQRRDEEIYKRRSESLRKQIDDIEASFRNARNHGRPVSEASEKYLRNLEDELRNLKKP